MTRRPTGETLAEHFARLTERIADLEAEIHELRERNAELRQEIDDVTDRERDSHRERYA